MKSLLTEMCGIFSLVAPFVGAWIEISAPILSCLTVSVAPFVGAWIEIGKILCEGGTVAVAPFVGAWIEIGNNYSQRNWSLGRSLRGSVD